MFSDKRICLQCLNDSSCVKEWRECNFVLQCPSFELDEDKKDVNIIVTVDDDWKLISTNEKDIIKPKTEIDILREENERIKKVIDEILLGGML